MNGATPVPGPIRIRGVSTDDGNLNPAFGLEQNVSYEIKNYSCIILIISHQQFSNGSYITVGCNSDEQFWILISRTILSSCPVATPFLS